MRGQLFPAIPSDPQAHTQDKFSAFELVGWKKRLFSHLVMLKILTWMTALISGVGGYDDGVDGDDGDEAEWYDEECEIEAGNEDLVRLVVEKRRGVE